MLTLTNRFNFSYNRLMIKTVFFDMDGVLIDSESIFINRSIKALEHFGFDYDLDIMKSCIGTSQARTDEIVEEMIQAKLPSNFEQVADTYINMMSIDFSQHKLNSLDELLEYLNLHDFNMGVCSSSTLPLIQKVVKDLNATDYFKVILSGDQFKESKPHPEIYLTAAKLFNVQPEHCLVIEDSISGVSAAKNAGMTCIAIRNDYYPLVYPDADYVIDDLSEVIGILESLK